MSPVSRRLVLLALGLGGWPSLASAKPKPPKVRWTILLHERADQARVEALLRPILDKETKKARWGKGFSDEVEATIDLRELRSSVERDVARVTCAAVGKIPQLGVARSRFSYGGRADERVQLERHVLELVTRGIIVRLAELAREKYGGWKVTH